jgi:signal peptidase I
LAILEKVAAETMTYQGRHARVQPLTEDEPRGEGEGYLPVVQDVSSSHQPSSRERSGRRVFREVLEILGIIVAAVLLTTLLKIFVVDQYEIPTGSMEPTIEIGDRLFAEKVSYYFAEPKPGDIITFNDPIEGGRVLIKRCIAVGGQTVDLVDGKVVVDGVALDEPYTHGEPSLPLEQMAGVHFGYPYTVPTGSVWVMGDNRTNSLDSRYFGVVPQKELIGRALFRFLPLDRFGAIDKT